MIDTPYGMLLAQLERAKGELRALAGMWYDPHEKGGGAVYREIKPMIEKFLRELSDQCG